MKKISFILLALISGTVFAQNEDNASADAFAEIVEPLSITNVSNSELRFGRIIGSSDGGIVTIAETLDGERSADNSNLLAPGGVESSAVFDISGSIYTYSVVANPTDLTYQGEATEGNTDALSLDATPSFENNTGDKTLYVGGTLTIGANQAAGNYQGSVDVTVTYE